jgi:hypothetical protein
MNLSEVVADWKSYERLISGLFVGSDSIRVEPNVKLTDKDGSERQIDCLVTVAFGPHEFRIVIESKSGSKPVERGVIDQLLMTKEKVNAAQAILFANADFQSGAINTAKVNGIRLLRVNDGCSMGWWPSEPLTVLCQVWSLRLEDRLLIPWRDVEVGTPGSVEWPKGIKAPVVSFYPNRSCTEVLGRQTSLEELLEDAAHRDILNSCSPRIGIIGEGNDCVGNFTIVCNVCFEPPIVVREREDPPVFLRLPKLSVNVAVRIEQRAIRWKPANQLDGALIIDDVVDERRYQVGRDEKDGAWTWVDMSDSPLGAGLGNNRRIVVTTREEFRPQVFDNPWTTFERVNIYGVGSVPESKTIRALVETLGCLVNPPQTPQSRRRRYDE